MQVTLSAVKGTLDQAVGPNGEMNNIWFLTLALNDSFMEIIQTDLHWLPYLYIQLEKSDNGGWI